MTKARWSQPLPTRLRRRFLDSRFRGNDVWDALPCVSAARMRSRSNGLGITVVCWSGICGLGSIEIGSLGSMNTLPLDHKSGSQSQLGLLPDINKPPITPYRVAVV